MLLSETVYNEVGELLMQIKNFLFFFLTYKREFKLQKCSSKTWNSSAGYRSAMWDIVWRNEKMNFFFFE